MQRRWFGRWNILLMGRLAVLALGVVQGALPYEQIKALVERQLRAMTGGGG
jgi:hypothetical protein